MLAINFSPQSRVFKGSPYSGVHGVPLSNTVLHQGYISTEYMPRVINTCWTSLTFVRLTSVTVHS